MPGDSTVNQSLLLYHNICKALDNGHEFCLVFFDVSKAFDKVWHKGLLFKLYHAGVQGRLLEWFTDYFSNRYQRVVLNGSYSDLSMLKAGVPQGSILGPLLFLVYINNIVDNLESNINLFADDTSLSLEVDNSDSCWAKLQSDINKINDWAQNWIVKFNPLKSESLVITRKNIKPVHPDVFMSNTKIPDVQSHKHLGIYLSHDGTWECHIKNSVDKAWSRINIMRTLKRRLDMKSLQTIYFSFIRPKIEYADVVWDNCPQYLKEQIDKIQILSARIVTGCTKLTSLDDLVKEAGWESLQDRRLKHKLILYFKMVKGLSPNGLRSLVPQIVGSITPYSLLGSQNHRIPQCRTELYKKSFLPAVIEEWNELPIEIRNDSLSCFKYYLNRDKPSPNKLYFIGERNLQVIHTQIRNKCSSINNHLFLKNIIDSPLCTCGGIETSEHFFF